MISPGGPGGSPSRPIDRGRQLGARGLVCCGGGTSRDPEHIPATISRQLHFHAPASRLPHHIFWGMINVTRSYSPVLSAIAAVLLFTACVDLTRPWEGWQDAATGSGGTLAPGTDAGRGGSGGSTTTLPTGGTAAGGAATGGTSQTATGGTAGSIVVDAGAAADAAATGDTQGTGGAGGVVATDAGTGGTGGVVAADAAAEAPGTETGDTGGATDVGAAADAASPEDVGLDVPFSADTLPSDLGIVASDTAETGESDGSSTDGNDGPGTGDVGTDSAPAPVIISIDFVGGSPNSGSPPSGTVVMGASESAGVKPATHWNSAPGDKGTLSSLVAASGSTTTASATWNVDEIDSQTDTYSNFFTDAPGDTRMMNGYLDPRSVNYNATITVTGLPNPVSSGYDVYLYFYSYMSGVETRLYQYNIGATTYSVTQTGPSVTSTCPAYRLASGADAGTAGEGNYVVFHNLNGDHFTLTARPAQNSSGQQRAPVNGIQIVYPSGD